MEWKIFYDDGSTFSSEDGSPEKAPGWGVIAIVENDDRVGRTITSRWDHYCHHTDGWYGHDLVGLMDCLAQPGLNAVCHGRTVSNDIWEAINKAANEDPDFKLKTAKTILEQPRGTSWTLTGRK